MKNSNKNRISYPFTVGFILYDNNDSYKPTEFHPMAKFTTSSEAIYFAKIAYKQFPSPHRNYTRVYLVRKRKKTIYRAG